MQEGHDETHCESNYSTSPPCSGTGREGIAEAGAAPSNRRCRAILTISGGKRFAGWRACPVRLHEIDRKRVISRSPINSETYSFKDSFLISPASLRPFAWLSAVPPPACKRCSTCRYWQRK